RLSENQNTVDCNDQGVQFLVAQVGSNLMKIIKSPVIEELNQLVVVKSSYIEEQLAIQVNLFDGGASISHRIADACSFSSFVCHWSTIRKRKEPTIHKNIVTKRFVFSSLAINELKCQVDKGHSTLVNATRVEVVTALIWKCGMVALGDCNASVAAHVVNFRRKMVPSLQDQQFGNLIQLASAVAHQTTDIASLMTKLRASLEKIDNNGIEAWVVMNEEDMLQFEHNADLQAF
nr:vinorine synthase-like [Tanacetum cinerariifolium]